MSERTILFIQGGGKGAYKADKELALYVKKALGETHRIVYPQILFHTKTLLLNIPKISVYLIFLFKLHR
jgi:hypothetical protein